MLEIFKQLENAGGPVLQALAVGSFTWLMTAIGASLVFLFKKTNQKILDCSLGFTGGVMVAASIWSLIVPAIKYTEQEVKSGNSLQPIWLPATIGFLLGACFLFILNKLIPHLHINYPRNEAEGIKTNWNKTILLVLAITLHNIPEGLAIGVAFGALYHDLPAYELGSAIALSLGIGIQNFPEGFAVAMPIRRQGLSRTKSFWWGQLSAVVEPIAAVIGAATVMFIMPLLPYALSFAAGAMIFIVVEEVIPESQRAGHTDLSSVGFICGFIVMMILDVALG